MYSPTEGKLEGKLLYRCRKLTAVSTLPASQYSSTSTTLPHLISLHLALERLRILARRGGEGALFTPEGTPKGPRVMVVGPPSSGKTTVVKNLVNMALGSGMGWTVGVAGIDPSSVSRHVVQLRGQS